MATLNIRQRILLGISTVLALWVLIIAVTYVVQTKQAELLERYSEANKEAQSVVQMQLAMVGLLPPLNGYLQSLEEEHKTAFEQELGNYKKAMGEVADISGLPPKVGKNIKEIKDLMENIRSTGSQVFRTDTITSTEK